MNLGKKCVHAVKSKLSVNSISFVETFIEVFIRCPKVVEFFIKKYIFWFAKMKTLFDKLI